MTVIGKHGIGTADTAVSPQSLPKGKWYWEASSTNLRLDILDTALVGISDLTDDEGESDHRLPGDAGIFLQFDGSVLQKGEKILDRSVTEIGAGIVYRVAVDAEAAKVWFATNDTWINGDPATGQGGTAFDPKGNWHPTVASIHGGDGTLAADAFFIGHLFKMPVPDGFLAFALACELDREAAGITEEAEAQAREDYYKENFEDPAINSFIIYDRLITRKQNSEIGFTAVYNGELFKHSKIKLNNHGFISDFDYDFSDEKDEDYVIVVVGGEQTASSTSNRSWPDFLQDILNDRKDRRFLVYNIGWPDAGPEHYIEYLKDIKEKVEPDLVIVNYVETDFYRGRHGSQSFHKFHGQPVLQQAVETKIPLSKGPPAVAFVNSTAEAELIESDPKAYPLMLERPPGEYEVRLDDPNVVAGRPYGFFVSPSQIADPGIIAELREKVVDLMIKGAFNHYGCVACAKQSGLLERVADLRDFDTFVSYVDPVSFEDRVKFGSDTFGWIARNIPNVVFTHTFHFPEYLQELEFKFSDALAKLDPKFRYYDMRSFVDQNGEQDKLNEYYMAPFMPEKFSDEGMEFYANLINRMLAKEGFLPEAD